jgi:hypothetical protein
MFALAFGITQGKNHKNLKIFIVAVLFNIAKWNLNFYDVTEFYKNSTILWLHRFYNAE